MVTHLCEARISAVLTLQSIRNRYNPGSFQFDVADHAIDLALSARRSADDYLVRNSLRDSKRILSRHRAKRPAMLSLDEEFFTNHGDGGECESITLHDVCVSPGFTPYEACAESDFEQSLRRRLGDSTPAQAAIDCLKNSAPAKGFHENTGMSKSYFKKLKKTIQREAAALN